MPRESTAFAKIVGAVGAVGLLSEQGHLHHGLAVRGRAEPLVI